MQRHCADVSSPYKRKCWTNSGGPITNSLLWGFNPLLPVPFIDMEKAMRSSLGTTRPVSSGSNTVPPFRFTFFPRTLPLSLKGKSRKEDCNNNPLKHEVPKNLMLYRTPRAGKLVKQFLFVLSQLNTLIELYWLGRRKKGVNKYLLLVPLLSQCCTGLQHICKSAGKKGFYLYEYIFFYL